MQAKRSLEGCLRSRLPYRDSVSLESLTGRQEVVRSWVPRISVDAVHYTPGQCKRQDITLLNTVPESLISVMGPFACGWLFDGDKGPGQFSHTL